MDEKDKYLTLWKLADYMNGGAGKGNYMLTVKKTGWIIVAKWCKRQGGHAWWPVRRYDRENYFKALPQMAWIADN